MTDMTDTDTGTTAEKKREHARTHADKHLFTAGVVACCDRIAWRFLAHVHSYRRLLDPRSDMAPG